MPNIPPEIYQAGAIAIIFLFAIKEFFNWLKNRNGNNQKTQTEIEIAGEVIVLDYHMEFIVDKMFRAP